MIRNNVTIPDNLVHEHNEYRDQQPGVVMVITPCHGYSVLSEEMNNRIPEQFRLDTRVYEEDCESLKIAVFIDGQAQYEEYMKIWFPEQYRCWKEGVPYVDPRKQPCKCGSGALARMRIRISSFIKDEYVCGACCEALRD